VTLRELLYDYGGGSASGRPIRAVQVGGPLGAYLPELQFRYAAGLRSLTAIGAMVGHGGIVDSTDTVDMAGMARLRDGILRHRILRQVHALPDRLDPRRRSHRPYRRRSEREKNIALLEDLCDTMLNGSLCALGGMSRSRCKAR